MSLLSGAQTGELLRHHREGKELGLEDLAARVPMSVARLSAAERGEGVLSVAELAALAAVLDADTHGFVFADGKP
jgi:transcriptional regulator with XRE-family HTH domain